MAQNGTNNGLATRFLDVFGLSAPRSFICICLSLLALSASIVAQPALAGVSSRAPKARVVNSEAASTERVAAPNAARPMAARMSATAPKSKVTAVSQPIKGPNKPRLAPIAIPASEPLMAPAVRPMDVQEFQKIGAPYQANGTWFIPAHEPDYNEVGTASWYGRDFHGRDTANGEVFDMNVVTAAHPTLPIPSLVEVTNLANGRSMIVRVNDRGPFVANRLIDLSARGAQLLGYQDQGSTQVRVRYVGPADPKPLVTAATLSPPSEEKKWAQTAPNLAPTPSSSRAQPALYVQAGAFSSRSNAQRALTQLAGVGSATIVESQNKDGMTLFRLVIGPVMNPDEARQTAQTISTFGLGGAHVLASID